MSANEGLGKLYDRLTPEERFRLDVEALARGDEQESRRLVDACPRLTYTMTDRRFSERWVSAIHLCTAALMDLRCTVAKLRTIYAFREALPYCRTLAQNDAAEAYFDGHEAGSRHAWSRAGKGGDPPGYEADEETAEVNGDPQTQEDLDEIEARVDESAALVPGLLERLERKLASGALGVWEGFSRICEVEIELPAEKLLRATFTPAFEDIGWFLELCERLEVEADPATLEECRGAMSSHWQRRLGR